MAELTQDDIDNLISCEKLVMVAPRRTLKAQNAYEENGLQVMSVDGQYQFKIFIRRNLKLRENFSVGLIYVPRDGSGEVRLVRCNGNHDHRNPNGDLISGFHLHLATEDALELGLKSDRYAELATSYATLEEAIYYFFSYTNVTGWQEFFPDAMQWGLFRDGDNR